MLRIHSIKDNRMTPEQFAYWLQGYAEIAAGRTAPTSEEWQIIKDHLALVFHKVTPNRTAAGQSVTKASPIPSSVSSTSLKNETHNEIGTTNSHGDGLKVQSAPPLSATPSEKLPSQELPSAKTAGQKAADELVEKIIKDNPRLAKPLGRNRKPYGSPPFNPRTTKIC
jgi:hypothetical protein